MGRDDVISNENMCNGLLHRCSKSPTSVNIIYNMLRNIKYHLHSNGISHVIFGARPGKRQAAPSMLQPTIHICPSITYPFCDIVLLLVLLLISCPLNVIFRIYLHNVTQKIKFHLRKHLARGLV